MINALNMKQIESSSGLPGNGEWGSPNRPQGQAFASSDGDLIEFRGTKKHASKRLSSFQWRPHSHPQSTEHRLSGQSGQTFSCATWEPTRAEEEEARSRFKLTTLFLWGNSSQHCTTTLHIFKCTSCPVLWSSEITPPTPLSVCSSLSHTHTQNIL